MRKVLLGLMLVLVLVVTSVVPVGASASSPSIRIIVYSDRWVANVTWPGAVNSIHTEVWVSAGQFTDRREFYFCGEATRTFFFPAGVSPCGVTCKYGGSLSTYWEISPGKAAGATTCFMPRDTVPVCVVAAAPSETGKGGFWISGQTPGCWFQVGSEDRRDVWLYRQADPSGMINIDFLPVGEKVYIWRVPDGAGTKVEVHPWRQEVFLR